MTKSQITEILTNLGYSTDLLIPLTEVNVIVLEGNFNIFPDGFQRFKFDMEHELLLVYRGHEEIGTFIPNEKPKAAHAFDQIMSIQMVSNRRQPAPYRLGLSM